MKTRTVLECILLFLIGFQAIDIALASYPKTPLCPAEDWNAVSKSVVKPVVGLKNNVNCCYSEVLYFTRSGPSQRIQSQVFSEKEIDLLTALSNKMDKKEFADFMVTSLVVGRSAFMGSALNKLQGPALIASNEKGL